MKLSALITLAALASSSAGARRHEVKNLCDTSIASPLLHHVEELVKNLKASDDPEEWCVFYQPGDDECGESIKKFSGDDGGAVFNLCKGPKPDDTFRCPSSVGGAGNGGPGLTFSDMGHYLDNLPVNCTRTTDDGAKRVGGRVSFNGGGAEIRLYTMPAK